MKKDNISKKIDNNLSIIDIFASLILSIFIITPFVLVIINLLYLYYDYEIWLVFSLVICFLVLVFLDTKFMVDIYKKKSGEEKPNVMSLYFKNILIADIVGIVVFIFYLLLRR